MKFKRFSTEAKILNGTMTYLDRNFNDDFRRFKDENPEAWVEITYMVVDTVDYYLHKYYRGFILPVIAQSKDRVDLYRIHTFLKKEYLYAAINGWQDIPDRFLEKGIAIIDEKQLMDALVPTGRTIVLTRDKEMIAYIPSTAHLTNDEMKEFIKKCEPIADGMDTLDIPAEIIKYRQFVYENEQATLFGG